MRRAILLAAVAVFVSACTTEEPAPTPSPTFDAPTFLATQTDTPAVATESPTPEATATPEPPTATPTPVATPAPTQPPPPVATARPFVPAVPQREVYYANCDAARAAGAAPVRRGDPGYRAGLDRDNDGVGCE